MGLVKFTLSKVRAMYGTPKYKVPAAKRPAFRVTGFQDYVEGIGEDLALMFLNFVIDNIRTNRYGFTLNPATVKRKKGTLPWINTEELLDALVVEGATVRFKKGVHKGTQLTYGELALILEYGMKERGMPPRAVFRRSFEDFKPIAADFVKRRFRV